MNIVLATDDNFVQHCSVTIVSILKNNNNVNFYVITEGLSDINVSYLKGLASENNGQLEIINVPSNIVKDFPLSRLASSHITIATYYRLFVPSILPNNISKVIYLDCDMVVINKLDDLWNTKMDDYAVGAVFQDLGWSDYNCTWDRLNIPREEGYFNAGTLLMNLDYLRRIDFVKQAIAYIKQNYRKIISHDQDVLNALLYNKVLPIGPKWNFLTLFLNKNVKNLQFPRKYAKFVENLAVDEFSPVVIHFVSKPKPWDFGCRNPYKGEYYKYLKYTKWHGYQPKFILQKYLVNVVRPTVIKYLVKIDFMNLLAKRKRRIIKSKMC